MTGFSKKIKQKRKSGVRVRHFRKVIRVLTEEERSLSTSLGAAGDYIVRWFGETDGLYTQGASGAPVKQTPPTENTFYLGDDGSRTYYVANTDTHHGTTDTKILFERSFQTSSNPAEVAIIYFYGNTGKHIVVDFHVTGYHTGNTSNSHTAKHFKTFYSNTVDMGTQPILTSKTKTTFTRPTFAYTGAKVTMTYADATATTWTITGTITIGL